jgi:glycogen operon protein
MRWFDAHGRTMSEHDWTSAENRTLQYLAASTPETEEFDRVLLIVHGVESDTSVVLAESEGVTGYTRLWSSEESVPLEHGESFEPGQVVRVAGTSMQLFAAHGPRPAAAS